MEMSDIAADKAALNSSASFDRSAFSAAIKSKMSSNNTLRKVSAEVELSIATLSRAMNGQKLSLDSTLKICTWLGKSINDFTVVQATC